jgi:hypothetical protein
VRLFDTTRGLGHVSGFSCSLVSKLFSWGLSSSVFSGCLLCSCHDGVLFVCEEIYIMSNKTLNTY